MGSTNNESTLHTETGGSEKLRGNHTSSPKSESNQTAGDTLLGIPAYNEEATIGAIVTAAKRYVSEVVVVDDGSNDNTVEEAVRAGATVIQHETNKGYGAALQSLFEVAQNKGTDQLVILDADGQHNANDIPKLLKKQRETGAEIVVGSRFTDDQKSDIPFYRLFGLNFLSFLINIVFKYAYRMPPVTDTQCGFRVYNRDAISSIVENQSIGDHMGASVDILLHAANERYNITEVPTTVNYNVTDSSTHNPIKHGLMVIGNLFRKAVKDRPIHILGIPGIICFLIGVTAVSIIPGLMYLQLFQNILITFGLLLIGGSIVLGRTNTT